MSSVLRLSCLVSFLLALSLCGQAQDLGSSNKLFGSKPATPASKQPATKKRVSKAVKPKRTTAKAETPKERPAKSEAKASDKKKTEAKTAPKTPVDPAAKKSPGEKTAGKTTPGRPETAKVSKPKSPVKTDGKAPPNTVGERFKTFGSSGKPADKPSETKVKPDKKVTAAEERRYEELINSGSEARYDRNYSAAEAAFRQARDIHPRDARALSGLGALYADQQRWEDAEKAYRAALQLDENDPTTQVALSYVLSQPLAVENLGDRYEDAEKLARRAIQSAPRNALAFDQLGAALELRGLIGSETEAAYRRAIDIDPSFAPSYAHLGRLLRRRGRTNESNAAYQKAIERANDAPTRVLVAEVMQSEQRFDESEKLLRYALEEDPRNPTALVLLGRVLATQGNFRDAEIMYRRAVDVSPNGYVPSSRLADLYLRQGKTVQAEGALFDAQRSVPKSERRQLAKQFEAVGDAYLKSGSRSNAARCYRIASTLDGESATLPGKLARTVGG